MRDDRGDPRPVPAGVAAAGSLLIGRVRLLHRLDARKGEALCVTTDHARLRAARFLDGRERFWSAEQVVPVEPEGAGAKLRIIFHVGFCGSTLLARLLDRPGAVLALKEPQALSDLASQAGALDATSAGAAERWLAYLAGDLAQLAPAGETLLVKPSSWINGLAPRLAADGLIERALFLSMDRRAFIAACFRGGRDRLAFATRLAALLAPLCPDGGGRLAAALVDDGDPFARMARVGALLHAQQEWLFLAAKEELAPATWGRLDFGELQRAPAEASARAADVLDLPHPADEAHMGAILAKHAKDPAQTFRAADREAQEVELERHHAHRFDAALEWLERTWPAGVSAAASP